MSMTPGRDHGAAWWPRPGPLEQVQTFSKRLAGADSNVAIGLARLGFKVGWVSRLGADSFGRYVRQAIEAEGVDTSQVAVDPNRSTGFMLKSRSLDGSDPAIVAQFRAQTRWFSLCAKVQPKSIFRLPDASSETGSVLKSCISTFLLINLNSGSSLRRC